MKYLNTICLWNTKYPKKGIPVWPEKNKSFEDQVESLRDQLKKDSHVTVTEHQV